MNECVACRRRIWPWQRTGFNTSWHLRCMVAWKAGGESRRSFDEEMCRRRRQPTPDEICEDECRLQRVIYVTTPPAEIYL